MLRDFLELLMKQQELGELFFLTHYTLVIIDPLLEHKPINKHTDTPNNNAFFV